MAGIDTDIENMDSLVLTESTKTLGLLCWQIFHQENRALLLLSFVIPGCLNLINKSQEHMLLFLFLLKRQQKLSERS